MIYKVVIDATKALDALNKMGVKESIKKEKEKEKEKLIYINYYVTNGEDDE